MAIKDLPKASLNGQTPRPRSSADDMPTGTSAPRQMQPPNFNILRQPGYSFVPRRLMGLTQYDVLNVNSNQITQTSPELLLDLLSDLNPEIAQALFVITRLVERGMKVEVRTPDDDEQDEEGQAMADALIRTMNQREGGVMTLVNQWTFSLMLRRGACAEVLPTADLHGVAEWFSGDPYSIYFSRDSQDNQQIVPYQLLYWMDYANMEDKHNPAYRQLNPELFFYISFDPGLDDPYGRAPAQPVLSLVFQYIQILQDLARWAHVNAWGHYKIEIDAEQVIALAPQNEKNDFALMKARVQQAMDDAGKVMGSLQPDDIAILTSYQQLDNVKGSSEGFDPDSLIRIFERLIIRALKMLPVFMGSNEGTTETHSNTQMEIFSYQIAAFQRKIAYLLEKMITVSLRLMGKAAIVNVSFDPVRTTDELHDEQTRQVQIANMLTLRDELYVTDDEAAIELTGTPIPDELREAAMARAEKRANPPIQPAISNLPSMVGKQELAEEDTEAQPSAPAKPATAAEANTQEEPAPPAKPAKGRKAAK